MRPYPLLLLLVFQSGVEAAAANEPTICFVRNGDIWRSDASGQHQTPLTHHTEGRVKSFLFSRRGDYAAYEKIVGPGKTTLSVIRLPSEIRVAEVPLDKVSSVELVHWTPDDKVRFFKRDERGQRGLYEMEALTGEVQELPEWIGRAEFSSDGQGMVYALNDDRDDRFRETLFYRDVGSKESRTLLSERAVLTSAFLPKNRNIAYVAVSLEGPLQPATDTWGLCGTPGKACKVLYQGPAQWKGAARGRLQPSPNSRYLGLFMDHEGFLLDAKHPKSVQALPSNSAAAWRDNDSLLLSETDGIYLYRADRGTHDLLLKNASQPVVIP